MDREILPRACKSRMPRRHAARGAAFLIEQVEPALAIESIAHDRLAGIECEDAADIAAANDFEQPANRLPGGRPGWTCRGDVHVECQNSGFKRLHATTDRERFEPDLLRSSILDKRLSLPEHQQGMSELDSVAVLQEPLCGDRSAVDPRGPLPCQVMEDVTARG